MIKINLRELKLLILSMAIFILSIFATAYAAEQSSHNLQDSLPIGDNRVKGQLDDFFQPTLTKAQLYLQDSVDAGKQGMVSRKKIESGTVAVFRYGNKKASGPGYFPATSWATREIDRFIREYLEDHGLDPDDPDLLEAQKVKWYAETEQKNFLNTTFWKKQKELGRELTEPEKEKITPTILEQYPSEKNALNIGIRTHLKNNGFGPNLADKDLNTSVTEKQAQMLEMRGIEWHTYEDQNSFLNIAWAEKQKELGRELTEDEKEKIKAIIQQKYPSEKDRLILEARKFLSHVIENQKSFLNIALAAKQKELGRELTEDEKESVKSTTLDQYASDKDRLILEARKLVGYTVGEQKRYLYTAWVEKQKELGRELTEQEKEQVKSTILQQYPLKADTQTDETEGIAIVSNTSIYKVHEIFSQKGKYSSYLPEFFLFSHMLTPEELSARRIKVNPFESLLFARFYIANMTVDYTDFNESNQSFRDVILNTPEGKTKAVIPVVTEAWTIDPRFTDDKGKFVPVLDEKTGKIIGHNGHFEHNNILVMDGYLEVEPYIAKDEQGFEVVDESRVLAVYHTYTRVDPYYRDLTGLTDMFREAEGRRFMEKMVSVIQKTGN